MNASGISKTPNSPDPGIFDALATAAMGVCDASIAVIRLLETSRQWTKACVEWKSTCEPPETYAFCAHVVQAEEVVEVVDARMDRRFADNPLVAGTPGIRHFAGVPIRLAGGEYVGSLCVFATAPRQLSRRQIESLQALSEATAHALTIRVSDTQALKKAQLEQPRLATFAGETPSPLGAERFCAQDEIPFRYWAENLPVIVSFWDRNLVCRFANKASRQWMGRAFTDVVGEHMRDLLGLEVIENDRLRIEAVLAGQSQRFERSVRDQNGQMRHIVVTHLPDVKSGQVVGFLTQVTDITELKDSQAELERAEASMQEAQRMGKIGHWVWDIQNDVTEWSAEMFRIAGMATTSRPPSREDRAKLYTPDSFARWTSLISEAQASGKTFATEIEFYRPDGTTGWGEARAEPVTNPQGEVIQLRGTMLDITERKRVQLALERSQDFLERTGSLAGVGGWEVALDTLDVHWSDQVCALHGRPAGHKPSLEEALSYFTETSRQDIEAAVNRALAGGPGFDLELQLQGHDGKLRTVRTVGSLVFHNDRPIRLAGALQDISERYALTSELTQQHEWMRVTLQSIGDAVITTDDEGVITWLNPVAERMTGWTQAEAKGLSLDAVFRLVSEHDQQSLANPVLSCLRSGLVTGPSGHAVLIARDGSLVCVEELASPIRDDTGALLGSVLVFHDQTAQRSQIKHRETHDLLTDLLNRREFEQTLGSVLQQAHRDLSPRSLLYVDLDQFKLFNDACGHHAGDMLLQQVAQMLREFARGNDTYARLGGDEFAVLLDHCELTNALRIAQQVCDRLSDHRYVHQGERYRVGASVAVVPIDSRWATVSEAMQAAERTCYAAKTAGRNRVRVWVDSDTTLHHHGSDMGWATRLEHALDEDRFVLYAQRIFGLQSETGLLNAEILLRKVTRDGELVSPGYFLQAAERFNLASRIDKWVLSHAVDFLLTIKNLETIGVVCINLSGQSVGDSAFQDTAFALFDRAGHALCQKICIEITETAAITNLQAAKQFISRAKALGLHIALDDFGAGNASFGYLKSLTIDKLKIDGQFISDLLVDELDQATVRCFIDVARVLKIKTVAEFVDNDAVLARIQEMGVDYAQGYYLHRPEPIEIVFGSV